MQKRAHEIIVVTRTAWQNAPSDRRETWPLVPASTLHGRNTAHKAPVTRHVHSLHA
jgi:hypothetical protein